MTKILLADDHKIIRDGLRVLIERERGMSVIGDAETGLEAVAMATRLSPDIVVMDIGMPDLNGIEAARQISAIAPNVKVIGLSMHSDRRYVTEMLRAGAAGYLLKDSAFEELAQAIRAVVCGRIYLSPAIADTVVAAAIHRDTERGNTAYSQLTEREREVLQQLAEGKSTRAIAESLYVSVKTVETHRRHIMKKLKLRSVAALTKYAIREGLTSPEP